MIFDEILEEIAQRSDGLLGVVIMGMDGIAIGEHLVDETCIIQTVGIEYASAIKSIQSASASLSAGRVEEVFISTEKSTFILRLVTDEYFIAVVLGPDGNFGKARYLMKLAAPRLVREFT
jgi:predicted regulator of Ras-like GTPase activity (Roadblock/LC7/MglB family)